MWDISTVSAMPSPDVATLRAPTGEPRNLRVLDWAGFDAAISYTFDDGSPSQIAQYQDLHSLGVHFTFYLIGNRNETRDPIWATALVDGHEIGNHTQSHLESGDVAADTDAGEASLQSLLDTPIYTMAAPYGAAAYATVAQTRYLINRGATDGLMAPNDDTSPFDLHSFIPPARAPTAVFKAKVDSARATRSWQILLVHGFADGPVADGAYLPVTFDDFAAGVTYAKSLRDVWIDSVVNIGAYWIAQKMFAALVPATEGETTTWTWSLPDHFPPGRYVRVAVDGGSLTQGGIALPWDSHGYYEVALDQGSLRLAP
jgi:peptidoglycan/xylan/chitin deacetylase (PgdA/CDA1 family)